MGVLLRLVGSILAVSFVIVKFRVEFVVRSYLVNFDFVIGD